MRIRHLECMPIEAIKDECLPSEQSELGISIDAVNAVLENCPVVVINPFFGDVLPFDGIDFVEKPEEALSQPSTNHHRSFTLTSPEFEESWQDSFGNTYSSVNLKGNNFSDSGLIETMTAPEGIIPFGLQDSLTIRRILKASRLLRVNGIGTEYIVGLTEPTEYLWSAIDKVDNSEKVSLPEYKRRLVETHWRSFDDEKRTPESYVELARKLGGATFYITMRAMDTPYRLYDIRYDNKQKDDFFDYVNKNVLSDQDTPLESDESLRYLTEIFAPRVAQNFAKMHALGLVHRFPVSHNLSALGSIVDLDSVHGETLGLGDDPIKPEDIGRDLCTVIDAIVEADWRRLFSRSEEGKSPSAVFAEQYLISYEDAHTKNQEIGDSIDSIPGIKAAEALIALKEFAESIDKEAQTIESHTVNPTKYLFEVFYSNMFFADGLEVAKDLGETWLSNNTGEVITDDIKATFSEEIQTTVQLLIDDFINELQDPDLSLTKLIESDKYERVFSVSNTADFLLSVAYSHIEQEFESYLRASWDKDKGPTLYNSLEDDYLKEVLIKRASQFIFDSDKANEQATEIFNSVLDFIKSGFAEALQVDRARSILEDVHSYPRFQSKPGFLAIETDNISLTRIADHLDLTDDRVEVVHAEDTQGPLEDNYTVSKGHILHEMISDSAVDGMSFDDNQVFSGMHYDIEASARYVAFVEVDQSGDRTIKLYIRDSALATLLRETDRAKIGQVIRDNTFVNGRLFDDNKYTKSIDFGIRLEDIEF